MTLGTVLVLYPRFKLVLSEMQLSYIMVPIMHWA